MFDMEDGYKGCMRLVDWERGNPYIYGAETSDFDVIINSSHLFARKFDIEKYPQIVYKIQEYIK